MKKKIIIVSLLVICIFSLCACSEDIDDVKDQVQNVAQAADPHVLGVKGGTNSLYPNVTYGEAFEAFFSSPTWKYFKGTQNGPDEDEDGEPDYTKEDIDVVEFTGYCTYSDTKVKALIQFIISEDGETFTPEFLSFNDVPQNLLMMNGLIEKVFTSFMEQHNIDTEDTKIEINYPDAYGMELLDKKEAYDEYCFYSVYDMDNDGIKELILSYGSCDADYRNSVYKPFYEDGIWGCEEVGSFDMIMSFFASPDGNGIIGVYNHGDYEIALNAYIDSNGCLKTDEIYSGNMGEGKYGLGNMLNYAYVTDPSLLSDAMSDDYTGEGE